MRNYIYYSFVIIIIQSCGNRTPIIDGDNPFVVEAIIKYDETHSSYFAVDNAMDYFSSFQGQQMIILPSRLYKIGDTIKSDFNK